MTLSRRQSGADKRIELSAEFFRSNPFPMFVFDPKNLNILDVNDAAVVHYGFSREEFVGMHMSRIRIGTEQELVRRFESLPKDRVQWFSSEHRKRDGIIINVKAAVGDIVWNGTNACFSIVHDVTDQLRIQADLTRVLSFAQIGIWEFNVATKSVTWTHEVYRILGRRSKNPIRFEQFLEHIVPEDRARFDAAFEDALVTGKPYEIEHRIRRLDGVERIVSASA